MLTCLLSALASASDLSDLLQEEIRGAIEVFGKQDVPTHYLALTVTDREERNWRARAGTLFADDVGRVRTLDVDLRIGSPALDSTHPLRGFSSLESDSRMMLRVPLDEMGALRHAVRRELDRTYRDERERYVMLLANQQVKVEEEDLAPDFAPRSAPVRSASDVPDLPATGDWLGLVLEASEALDASPIAHDSTATVSLTRTRRVLVDTEGSHIEDGSVHGRLTLSVSTTAEDGDQVDVYRTFDAQSPDRLPTAETVTSWAREMVSELEVLRKAPRGDPYSGPVILRGRAAGVFFHEVLGHRVEGHRQKRETEGKTFADQVGKPILPAFVDVYDDPTIQTLAGTDLNGHYRYDDEGTPASRAIIVENGVFRGFLMSRSPLQTVPDSNGHGRRSPGNAPLARMGNLVVESEQAVPYAKLRTQLVDILKAEHLPYGYVVDDIAGGFTMTGRLVPNAFNIRANSTWRVYADGRPDEQIRGIDLVGTPLVAFSNLVATGDDVDVFNGVCGAESGWVPVSAVSPSVLFRRLEFQLKEKEQDRPPLLAKPAVDDNDGASWETP